METSYEFRRWWKGYITSTRHQPTLARIPHHHFPPNFLLYIFFFALVHLLYFPFFPRTRSPCSFFSFPFYFYFFIPFFLFLVGVCVFSSFFGLCISAMCVYIHTLTRTYTYTCVYILYIYVSYFSYTYNNNSTMNIKRHAHAKGRSTTSAQGQGIWKSARKVEHAMNRCQTILSIRSTTAG